MKKEKYIEEAKMKQVEKGIGNFLDFLLVQLVYFVLYFPDALNCLPFYY